MDLEILRTLILLSLWCVLASTPQEIKGGTLVMRWGYGWLRRWEIILVFCLSLEKKDRGFSTHSRSVL
ncbi:hypothetical protein ERO13_D09G032333v2 [Gossypium hirsutum]|uniref:Uncharacterized protein n=1 Tax=Gossypium darwinii TaxID=34276 RepID=A0A5D2B922_GOSDA|nr:hypothetical protein ERO13_D09G032333v2 [Gossypium hirsutum]TYG52613.1 hypothetical protein ES288_D09G042100v1 [Gossypium darwinii]